MKNEPLWKILIIAIGIITALVGFIFKQALANQDTTNARQDRSIQSLEETIKTQNEIKETLGRMDERLKNIERSLK